MTRSTLKKFIHSNNSNKFFGLHNINLGSLFDLGLLGWSLDTLCRYHCTLYWHAYFADCYFLKLRCESYTICQCNKSNFSLPIVDYKFIICYCHIVGLYVTMTDAPLCKLYRVLGMFRIPLILCTKHKD